VGHSDVDFALKLRARGLRILWTPSITLRHYESKTRGIDFFDTEKQARHDAERKVVEQRWGLLCRWTRVSTALAHGKPIFFDLIMAPPSSGCGVTSDCAHQPVRGFPIEV